MILITDSTADIRGEEIKQLNLRVVPLRISFQEETYRDCVDISVEEFYQKLKTTKTFPKTSQPSPEEFQSIFEEAKQKKEDVIYLAVSSGLSGTINSARIAKENVGYQRIFIVDTLESIQGLRLLVHYACKLRDENKTAEEIVAEIERVKNKIHIYSMIDTLEYLYRGGRLSRAIAFIGNLIDLKPLIDLDPQGKIRMYGKAFGRARAFKSISESLKNNPIDHSFPVYFGYTDGKENVDRLIERTVPFFNIKQYDLSQIGPTIGSHIGAGGFCVIYVSTKDRT